MQQEQAPLHSVYLARIMEGSIAQRRPIDKIPPELLLLVFEEYCRSMAPLEPSTSNECRITHICRFWRMLSIDLSTLWARLNVSVKTPISILSIYLQRSNNLTLDIEVDLRHDPEDKAIRTHATKLWEIIKSTAYRWRRLNIHIGPHDATSVAEELRQLAAPFLEDIRMTCYVPIDGLTQMFKGCTPALTSLRLWDVSLQQFTPSLANLTRLHLASTSPMKISAFRELVSQMIKLEELTLRSRVVEGWPVYPEADDIITLPSLTTLKLSDRRWPLFVPLLSIFAPNLTSLSLYDLVGHDLPDTLMEHYILEQYPSVRNLTLKGKSSFIDEVSFAQLARMFPAVDHFALLDVNSLFTTETCHTLHEPALWPKLRTLSMIPMAPESVLCSLISVRGASAKHSGLNKLVGPMPIQFKRMEWISQRVLFEECHDSVSGVGQLHK